MKYRSIVKYKQKLRFDQIRKNKYLKSTLTFVDVGT